MGAPKIKSQATLLIQNSGHRVSLGEAYVFGRDSSFPEIALSRQHFTIACNAAGDFYIKDMLSRTGTFLDGRRLPQGQWFRLASDSEITAGSVRFVLTIESSAPRPRPLELVAPVESSLRPQLMMARSETSNLKSAPKAPRKEMADADSLTSKVLRALLKRTP